METKKLKKILAIIFCICLAIYFAYAVILLIIHPTEIYVITKGEIKEEEEEVLSAASIREADSASASSRKAGAKVRTFKYIFQMFPEVFFFFLLERCIPGRNKG